MSPSVITGEQKRPDIVVIDKQRSCILVLELTVGFETGIKENAVRINTIIIVVYVLN